ncbi:MAG TPA: O-antigen ligase family protein, partial [Pirellulaceae bacterium]|nr:O-antigen ligase family protein [Pirellulaceae bacterium]
MSTRRRKPSSDSAIAESSDSPTGERLRPVWLGGVAALFVATPLIPSEAAPAGLGVALLMAWFALFSAFVVTGAVQGTLRLRLSATDVAVFVFITLHTVSALVLADAGQPRQTLNMLWQWIGFGVAFLLVRQVVRTAAESRALVAVMIALAVCLSMHGYFQYFYSMPEARREYEADRDGRLAQVGIDAPEGSIAREQFENRLYSTEPMATFTLANSLAGFLGPWLLCAIGITALNWSTREMRLSLGVSAGLSVLLIAGCFVLTKSRSATLAVLIGVATLALYGRQRGWRPGLLFVFTFIASLVALAALAVFVGGLDLLVLTESSKSLLYRVQYWRSSLAMIADSPWFGCGPGNFQETYTAYKLPEASETIADPHNFLIEVWATAGTPAMIAFLSVLICFALQMRRCRKRSDSSSRESDDLGCVRGIYWGAFAGLPLGFVAGLVVDYVPDFALFVVGLPIAVVSAISWHAWVVNGRLPVVVLVVVVFTLLINLSAAGGISFAGVALTLWLLLATALNLSQSPGSTDTLSKKVATAVAVGVITMTFLFWYSTFAPILKVSMQLQVAGDLQTQGRFLEAEQVLANAARTDSYSVEPWQMLAQLRLAMWLEGGDASREAGFVEAARETLAHHRRSRAAHQAYGDWYLRAYRTTGE